MCLTGVRWAESQRRSETRHAYEVVAKRKQDRVLLNDNDEARRYFEHCVPKGKRICNPIVDWTEDNVWRYIYDRGLPYCTLYDEGVDRIGCIGCPMAGDRRWDQFDRWPKFDRLYIRAFDRMIEAKRDAGKTVDWETGQDVYDWWMDNRNLDKPLPGQIHWEDVEDER